MKRFRWNNSKSEAVVIQCAIIRIQNRRMSVDEALRQTIAIHSTNSDSIPEKTYRSLRRQVEEQMKPKRGGTNGKAHSSLHAAQ